MSSVFIKITKVRFFSCIWL